VTVSAEATFARVLRQQISCILDLSGKSDPAAASSAQQGLRIDRHTLSRSGYTLRSFARPKGAGKARSANLLADRQGS